jgi:isoquinoline 1-oxidoreductase subunit alpha
MQLKINGAAHEVVNTDDVLLWALRDEVGLTGTKFGCGVGICGACTVHVDGAATRSCLLPVNTLEGKEIRTIEGLAAVAADGTQTLHPVQQAFIDDQTPQCGWCMSGQIMTAAAFLAQTPNPTDEQIVEAMGNNYCRCGCYVRIKRSVMTAVQLAATAQSQLAQKEIA